MPCRYQHPEHDRRHSDQDRRFRLREARKETQFPDDTVRQSGIHGPGNYQLQAVRPASRQLVPGRDHVHGIRWVPALLREDGPPDVPADIAGQLPVPPRVLGRYISRCEELHKVAPDGRPRQTDAVEGRAAAPVANRAGQRRRRRGTEQEGAVCQPQAI